ncbi:hypothetical protein LINPERHAP1_LOCUS6336, partial [Linum perenne]
MGCTGVFIVPLPWSPRLNPGHSFVAPVGCRHMFALSWNPKCRWRNPRSLPDWAVALGFSPLLGLASLAHLNYRLGPNLQPYLLCSGRHVGSRVGRRLGRCLGPW